MDVSQSHTYAAPVAAVIDMFADADAITQRYAGMGHRDIEVRSCDRTDDSLTVVSSRVVEVDLPGFAKKVLSPTNTMVQTDEWRADGDGWSGSFHVEVAGAPVELSGSMALAPDGAGTRHDVTITMKGKVPLVGGRIADWAGKNDVPKTLDAEFRAGDEWLAAHPA